MREILLEETRQLFASKGAHSRQSCFNFGERQPTDRYHHEAFNTYMRNRASQIRLMPEDCHSR